MDEYFPYNFLSKTDAAKTEIPPHSAHYGALNKILFSEFSELENLRNSEAYLSSRSE